MTNITIKTEIVQKVNEILMSDLNPLQIARITSGNYKDHIVMRTSSTTKMEVMDISHPGDDECWTTNTMTKINVEVLDAELTVIIKGVL